MPKKLTYEEITAQRFKPEDAESIPRIPLIGMLENIRSLYNVGSIFRTSDAIGLERLVLSGFTGQPPRKEIEKTALGATETVPWHYEDDSSNAVKQLKSEGYTIAVLEHCHDSRNIFDFEWGNKLVLCVGNEVFGVTDEVVELADVALEIPMFGVKQSLNVAVAYGIAMYALRNNFKGDL
ncbi:MAG: TrmH family RNA methyltransferase [Calditrichia bacterium]